MSGHTGKRPRKSGCWLGTFPSVLLGVRNRYIFPSNLPKCLTWLQNRKLYVCFVVGFRSFSFSSPEPVVSSSDGSLQIKPSGSGDENGSLSQNFPLGAPIFRIPQGKINRFLTLQAKNSEIRIPLLGATLQPRPQVAFPWLWRWGGTTYKAREKRPGNEVGDTWESIENTVGQKVKKYRAANAAVVLVRSFKLGTWLIFAKKF